MSDNYRVVLDGAVRVAEVDSADEAVSVAIAKSGKMLNPDLDYVTIRATDRACPDCDVDHAPAFVVAGDALVALQYELTVFNADSEEHAGRIARSELGRSLVDVPLEVASIDRLEDQPDTETSAADTAADTRAVDESREEQLPEFEDAAPA